MEPPVCTRKEMCMANPKACEKLRGNQKLRLCHTAPNFKVAKRSVMGCTRPRIVSFKDDPPSLSRIYSPNKLEPYLSQVFEKVKDLGNGSFGNVQCMKCKEDNLYYAVKCSQAVYRSSFHRNEKLREVKFLEELNHPNIIKFYSAWEETDLLYIQTELCEISLQDYIFDKDGQISRRTVWNAFLDTLSAVKYIHDKQFVHVDIKPDNILVAPHEIFKLGDFGTAVDLINDENNDLDHEGDARYLAEEALNMEYVTKKMDIFSLGLSIFQLATDLWVPQNGNAWHEIRNGKFSDDILSKCPIELRSILLRMMSRDPDQRPEAGQILQLILVREKLIKRVKMAQCYSPPRSPHRLPSLTLVRRSSLRSSPQLCSPISTSRLFENSSLYTPTRSHLNQLRRVSGTAG